MTAAPVRLADLVPVEYNPRTIKAKAAQGLGDSIAAFGFLQPLVINRHPGREGRIVGGEQRWRQLTASGTKTVPNRPDGSPGVVYVDLPLDRERELNLRLNVGGEWDTTKLLAEFTLSELGDLGLEGIGRPAPPDFPTFDELATDFCCPACQYEWSGNPRPPL